jgi:serine/threonine-protein kinase
MSPNETNRPVVSPQLLAALVAGGFLASLWALFQWGELLVARAGGTPFCAIGGTFNCSAVWDSGFARTVHDVTKVPVAGWGLMWGVAAFALPLLALVDNANAARRGLTTAMRVTALAGVLSVGGLATASFVAGAVCIGCIGTYVVVAGWSVLAFLATKESGFAEVQKGVFWAGGVTLAAYLVVLVPGTRTPHALSEVGKDAIAKAAAGADDDGKKAAPPPSGGPGPFDGPSTGDPAKDEALGSLMGQIPPEALQMMSDLLADYEKAPPAAQVPAARVAHGDAKAPVVVVDWTDPLCPHCAELHEVMAEIMKVAPGAVRVEPHFFPLDGACNASVQRKNESGEVRCAATKALLCLEKDPDKFNLAQKLVFENQAGLDVNKLWEVLKPVVDRKSVEACMASPETQKKLDEDIAAANANHLEGTPLVLLNGKEVKPFGPVLYALVLTGGQTKSKAFASLPAPKPLPSHH